MKNETPRSRKIIACKIDVTKIDKARLFEGRNGAKYLDAVLIETPDGKYGDFMICQSVTKEEREAGTRGAILGNGKYVGGNPEPRRAPVPDTTELPHQSKDEDIPF